MWWILLSDPDNMASLCADHAVSSVLCHALKNNETYLLLFQVLLRGREPRKVVYYGFTYRVNHHANHDRHSSYSKHSSNGLVANQDPLLIFVPVPLLLLLLTLNLTTNLKS